jgi:hypothetical protein
MRLYLASIFIISSFLKINAQNYIDYFNLCNAADKQVYRHHYDSALIDYQQAFKLVDYIHAEYCKKASICAMKTVNLALVNEYSTQALKKGISEEYLNSKEFKPYRKTKGYKQLIDSLPIYKNQYALQMNLVYAKAIDSLTNVDQKIIRNTNFYTEEEGLSIEEIQHRRDKMDSINFACLIDLIHKYGFPSEKNLPPLTVFDANLIIHHNLRQPKNKNYLPEFKSYIEKGEYLPSSFAGTYDQMLMLSGEKSICSWGAAKDIPLSESDIQIMDSTRRTYGLKPIEAFNIMLDTLSQSKTVSPIW